MVFFLLERVQSWRYIRPLQNPPTANRAAWYRRMSPADGAAAPSRGSRRNPRRKSVASGSSSLPATIVRRVRSSLGLAETGKGGRRGTAATTTSSPHPPLSPSPFKASPSSSLPSSPTPFDCCQHRHRRGTIVYDRFKSALQRLFAPSPSPAAGRGRKRGQKTPPAAAVGPTSKTKKKKKRRRGKRQRRPRAKESSPLCGGDAGEDALLLSPPPSSAPARRGRREVRITPAKIPTLPAPVWPEYLYSYDEDGDSARRRRPTMFAPAASNLNFGLVTLHSLFSHSTEPGEKRRAMKGGGTGGQGGGRRGSSIWHLL